MQPADTKRRLIEILKSRSVRWGQFTLASGKSSDLYVDVRQTALNSEGAWLVGQLVLDRLRPDVVAVGGLTLGADPIACAAAPLAWAAGREIHAFLIRKEPKGHGTTDYLEGRSSLAPGAKVCVVEDTTTTGGSLLKAVERARLGGLEVVQCLTVVDRQEGAAEALAAEGLLLEALVTRAELV